MSDDLAHRPVARVDGADVVGGAGSAKAAIQDSRSLVEVDARNAAERTLDEPAMRRDREPPDLGQVGALEVVLEGNPPLPGVFERDAEHEAELVRVVARAALVAAHPLEHVLGRPGERQPGHEARAVEVGIGAGLEVRAHAVGLQA
ncbi:MAG: hypothetical protein MUD07_11280, partial [Burkholderiaceae bacterium]|nr:hypothetical protein [Burkholderiaceae bacterium]